MRLNPAIRVACIAAFATACSRQPAPSALPAPLSSPHAHAATGAHSVRVEIDPARREVVVLAGPFHVPGAGEQANDHPDRTPLIEFDWPVDGWIRGFRITAFDAAGRQLPRDIMHHLIAYNFSRRQLIHPGIERLFGIGAETRDIVLHRSVGVPLQAGSSLGFDAVWHNQTGQPLHDVYLRVAVVYTPERAEGIRFEGLPFHVDVNYSIAGSNEFDIPPGRSEHSVVFVMPASGRLIGIGGHLHEHGVGMRVEDVETERTLFRLKAKADAANRVVVKPKVFTKLFGLRDSRMRLEAGRRYRLISVYINATRDTIPNGAMAHIAGLFAPDDPASWPTLSESDPDIAEDIAVLRGQKPRESGRSHRHDSRPSTEFDE